MPSPSIPAECIYPILIHLKTDKKTLHSCLLVNYLWCSETVRILWHQPFRLLYTCIQDHICCEEKRMLQAENLLLTYLSCMLYQYNEELVKNFIISKPVTKPLFNYVQFLQNLDLYESFAAIQDYIELRYFRPGQIAKKLSHSPERELNVFVPQTALQRIVSRAHTIEDYRMAISYVLMDDPSIRSSSDSSKDVGKICEDLTNVLSKLFMKRSTKLYRLSIDVDCITRSVQERACKSIQNIRYVKQYDSIYYQSIPKHVGSENCLSQLTELIIPSRINKTKLLLALIPVSKNLKKVVVRVDYTIKHRCGYGVMAERPNVEQEAKSLANLIKVQRSLVHLGLHSCTEGLNHLLASIESQVDTLKYLSFKNVGFYGWGLFKNLAPLKNLAQLQFSHCTFKLPCDLNPFLGEINFPKLTNLEMQESSGADQVLKILSEATCGNPKFNIETEACDSIFDLKC